MANVVPTALLIALISGYTVVVFSTSTSQKVSSTLPCVSFFDCYLITFSFRYVVASDMVCCLLSNGVPQPHSTSDLPITSLFILFNLRNFSKPLTKLISRSLSIKSFQNNLCPRQTIYILVWKVNTIFTKSTSLTNRLACPILTICFIAYHPLFHLDL